MPLLSRFRRTVNSVKPKANNNSTSTNNNGKSAGILPHSYLRSTKSSTDKSLKPSSSFRGYLTSDSNRKDSIRNNRLNGNGTPKTIEIDYARDGPLLRRSSTFTLDDDEIENVPDQQLRHRHNGDNHHGGGDVSGNDEYHHRNSDINSYGRNRGKPVYGFYYVNRYTHSHHIHIRVAVYCNLFII